MSEANKRKSSRKRASYVVEFYDQEGILLAGVGSVLDLSATGALVESILKLQVGDKFWIRIRRNNKPRLEFPATVVRISAKGLAKTYGIRFERNRP